ncbi:ParB/RepB/Spo0J family partition protein [Breznakia pachnodae]|uniref:ParB-like chromosome segregation protein Spo0J n=1 Tax=Breznakia pachnodae TaxID=265178 RepID=A0ABU0E950_9FIRM|nr:ParB N-terminal domain-containing protein [Breznakia pachnodae]MDQ0363233.1 ParB-like chromosome segregation protein Spo0J [Breznakia pachnodae]
MTGINNLLNDASAERANKKITILQVDEIERNILNKAPIEGIEDLAELIKSQGLINPIIVYKVKNHHYRLIAGERRWTACKYLEYEEIPAIIVEKPGDEISERIMILDANSQRPEDTKDYKKKRAEEYGEIHDLLKADGKIPTGTLRQDWIGVHMGVSGRTISRYLNEVTTEGSKSKPKEKKQPTLVSVCKRLEKTGEQLLELDELEVEDEKLLQCYNSIQYTKQILEDQLAALQKRKKKHDGLFT